MVRELVVLSGKGGTGKTSIVAAFACLAENAVVADCDVDAADLHLVLEPRIDRRATFRAGHVARIREADCVGCGTCRSLCRFGAIDEVAAPGDELHFRVDPTACEGCGVCVHFCPEKAIDFPETVSGEWYVSATRVGPMVHARLGIAEENSGKLVTLIRKEAKRIAEESGRTRVLVDGSPGIGCPVMASLTGANLACLVIEPTPSGLHDAERIAELTARMGVRAAVTVNKWDLNPEMAERAEEQARGRGLAVLGRVPYDPDVTAAQIECKSVVEFSDGPASKAVRELWSNLDALLGGDHMGARLWRS